MKKTIGQIVGRVKFTENEIAMARGLADAVYDINLEFSEKENIKLSKEQKNEIKQPAKVSMDSYIKMASMKYPSSGLKV